MPRGESPAATDVSVVISTFERPDSCERALLSVLGQSERPLEILVCDDGSADQTRERFEAWAAREPLVRYVRAERNSGTPAVPRNLGVAAARGTWVAFLDDDDEWLPGKLARQCEALGRGGCDVLAANALRGAGGSYFPAAPEEMRPSRADLLRANPVITSTAVVRRELAEFPVARWLRGIEDYAAWLALADRGAAFLVLGEPLIRYADEPTARLSTARASRELALARLSWLRAARPPFEAAKLRVAARRSLGAVYVAAGDALRRTVSRRAGRAS